ncbi:hypothetical protein KJ633_04485 [bacterium]|nr:hypothetical protein [bacterium]
MFVPLTSGAKTGGYVYGQLMLTGTSINAQYMELADRIMEETFIHNTLLEREIFANIKA